MQPENISPNLSSNEAPHPNYKRIIVVVAVFFIIVIAGAFVYQYFVNKKAEKARDLVLRAQYQTELISEAQTYFSSLPPRSQETADKQRKEAQEFFKNLKPATNTTAEADLKTFFTTDREQAYQEWKAAQQ